jgi:predicted PurR-regulated permease PerM
VSEASVLLPKAFRLFTASVRSNPLGSRVVDELGRLNAAQALPILKRLPLVAVSATVVIGELLAVLVGGLYLAAQPALYRKGLLKLLPKGARDWTDGYLDEAGDALRKWLMAQLVAMVSVGLLVGLGMWIVGVPTPMALGLFAGLAEFVPVAGPIVSAIPALLLALLHGFDKALWTLGLFCLVQQFEGHVILPLTQRHFAALPPVVTLFAILGFAVVFGPLGVLLGVPLTVVVVVAVKRMRFKGRPTAGTVGEAPP